MTNAILRGKPDTGNPHVRFDEGEVASAKPRRGSLLYKKAIRLEKWCLLSILALLVSPCAFATVYYHTGSDLNASAKAFEDETRWTDRAATPTGVAPIRNENPDDEYVLDSGGWFRGNVTTQPVVFKFKSFTIYQSHVNWKVIGNSSTKNRTTIPLFVLAGYVKNNAQVGHLELGAAGTGWIDGKIEVKTARATPFYIESSDSAIWTGLAFDSDVYGESTTGLKFQCSKPERNMKIAFNGNNANYFGNYQVSGNTWIQFKDAASFGGTAASTDADALILNDGAILEVTTQDAILPASMNRGIVVNSEGVSNVTFRAETDWTLGFPLSGSGDVIKDGAGMLTIDTDWPETLGMLTVKAGNVRIGPNCTKAPKIIFLATPGVTASCTDTAAQTTFDYGDADFVFPGPIPVKMTDQPANADITEELTVPVLRFRSSAYTLRPCDFNITDLVPALRNEVLPIIETDSDGFQVVSIKLLPYIFLSADWQTAAGKYCPSIDINGVWQTAGIPSGGVGNYCAGVDIGSYFTSDFRVATYGGSGVTKWTFGGATFTTHGAIMVLKEKNACFGDLRVTSNPRCNGVSWVGAQGAEIEGRGIQELSGHATVINSSRTQPVNFIGRSDTRAVVSSSFHGNGWVAFLGTYVDGCDKPDSLFKVTGDNGEYIGGFTVSGKADANHDMPVRFLIDADTKATSFGGRPFAFMPDALTVTSNAVVEVRTDYAYDTENRGLAFAQDPEICVSNGCTFAAKQLVTFEAGATVTKTGAGTFAAKRMSGVAGTKLAVAAGGFQPLSAEAVEDVAVEFGAAGALVLDADATDAELQSKGLKDADGALSLAAGVTELKVQVRFGGQKDDAPLPTVGILTVPDAQADYWESRIRSAKVLAKGFSAEIGHSSDGTYTTFSATLSHKGLMILFR